MKLFFLTQLSDLVLGEALKYPNSIFVSPIPEIHNKLQSIGINCQYIPSFHHTANDKLFYQTFMPGMLKELELDGFPLWKSLAIDRFRFWFNPSHLPDIVNQLKFDELFVAVDIYSNLPWAVAMQAYQHNIPITGMKTHSLRTREFYSYYPHSFLNNIIVSFKDEKEYLNQICPEINVTVSAGERPKRKEIESQRKEDLRSGLQIPKDAYVNGVIFDKRDEWQFRRLLSNIREKKLPVNLYVFPYDERSEELFPKCVPFNLRQGINVQECDDQRLFAICDELVMFRFLEDIYNHMPNIPIAIYDFHDLNLSSKVAIDSVIYNETTKENIS